MICCSWELIDANENKGGGGFDCSALKLMAFSAVMRWGGKKGMLSPSQPLVRTSVPLWYFMLPTTITSIIPIIYHHHYLFWVFLPKLTEHTCQLHQLNVVWIGWGLFELDEGGQLAGQWFHLITSISMVHAISKSYSFNRGTGLATYLLIANVLCMFRLWHFLLILLLLLVAHGF